MREEEKLGVAARFDYLNESYDVMTVDIYANSRNDIENCKRELERRLEKCQKTLMWDETASYQEDRDLISQLKEDQVCNLMEKSRQLYESSKFPLNV